MNDDSMARFEALLRQGSMLHAQYRLDEAQSLYEQAARLQPGDFRGWYLLGVIALTKGQPQLAAECIDSAIRINPGSAEAYTEHGNAMLRLDRDEDAIASYDRAIVIAPNQAAAHCNRGNALYNLKRYEEAIASYANAIAIRPDSIKAINGRGNSQYQLRRYAAAADSYAKLIGLERGNAEAHNNLGNALSQLRQFEAAIASYDRAIGMKSDYAGAFYSRGKVLHECQQYAAAIADYDAALALGYESKDLRGMRLHARLKICDWHDLDAEAARLMADVESARAVPNPFTVLVLSGSAALQKKAAQNWVREECPPVASPSGSFERTPPQRIRVGYFSADFHHHATSHLMAGLFEMHDRSRFEVTAFSFGPDSQDEMRERIKNACEYFVDVRDLSDPEISNAARKAGIDIAVDLKGFTQDGRPGVFARRCAPLQVSYLGYPGTMGAPYMDYLIADRTLIPPGSEHHYTEQIIYLPDSYQVNDAKRRIAGAPLSRLELGLPQSGFVFCCFNNNYKILPAMFDIWMRILTRVKGAVLWLLEDNAAAMNNLRREAQSRNVNAERLIFAKRVGSAEHLSRHRAADLFLDTIPCNAHTTASDSLWAGLPVLTCMTEAFAGRVAASLLNALALPELIAAGPAEYERRAVMLAEQPEPLAVIRRKLERSRSEGRLFDTQRYTAGLEDAFARIHRRQERGLPPEHLQI